MTANNYSREISSDGAAQKRPRKPEFIPKYSVSCRYDCFTGLSQHVIEFVASCYDISTWGLTPAMPCGSCCFEAESMATGLVSTLTPLSAPSLSRSRSPNSGHCKTLAGDPLSGDQPTLRQRWGRTGFHDQYHLSPRIAQSSDSQLSGTVRIIGSFLKTKVAEVRISASRVQRYLCFYISPKDANGSQG